MLEIFSKNKRNNSMDKFLEKFGYFKYRPMSLS